MSNPMLAEKSESSSSGSSSRKWRERKMWKKKKPIKISRLPSFGFSGSDFTVDQIPVIFSGYTAESEDSSSSDMSDDSRTFSKSSDDENDEIDQERARSVKKREANLKSMKILRRQSTRKVSGLKKMRSMKRLTSNSRHILKKKSLDSIPHYLRPTSSSASKNVQNSNLGGVAIRLKRTSSLRYNGLLKATTSSAMKGSSKMSSDVCTYRYCSLHGTRHSHAADNSVTVPSLKRFVSMRRKFLKRQKSVNRRLVLLKRSLSRRRGPPLGGGIKFVSDQESNQEVFEEDGNDDSESNGRSWETVVDNGDGGIDSMEIVAASSPRKQWVKESAGMDLVEIVASPRKQWVKETIEIMDVSDKRIEEDLKEKVTGLDHDDGKVEGTKSEDSVEVCREGSSDEMRERNDKESKSEIMDGFDGGIDQDLTKNAAQWHDTCRDIAMDIDHDNGKVEGMKSQETVEDNEEVCREEERKNTENIWSDKESKPETMDDSDGSTDMTGLDYDNQKVEGTKSEETVEDNEEVCRGEEGKNTKNAWNDTVTLVKQAFDEILEEITDDNDTSDDIGELTKEDDSSDSASSSDMQHIEERDTHLTVIVSTSHMVEEESDHKRGAKKWGYLKRVILLKSFLKSLDRREKRNKKLSDGEESEKIMKLRRELVGEKKNAEEWMLDHALRQVISTLAPSQKRKVKHLVKAFESLIPMDGGNNDLASPGREENETVNVHTLLREDKDIDLEETKLTSDSLESKTDSHSIHDLAVEEESDETVSGLSMEKEEEKTGDSETQNLSTWRNLIQKNMVENREIKRDETEEDDAAIKWFQQAFETILSEIPDEEEIVLESSKEEKEEEEDQRETKKGWNSLRKVILLKRFVNSLEKVRVLNPRKLRNLLPVESELEKENVLLRHRSTMDRRRRDGEEMMLDYALRQAISRLAPIQRKKVELLVEAFDTVIDGSHETTKQSKNSDTPLNNDEANKDGQRTANVFSRFQVHRTDLKEEKKIDSTRNKDETGKEETPRVQKGCEVNKDEQRNQNVFSRFQVRQKDLKGEEKEIDSTLNKDETGEEETPRIVEGCEANKDENRIQNVFSRFQVHRMDLKEEEKEIDSTLNKNDAGEEGQLKEEEGCEVNKDEKRIKNVFSRFQVHQKDLKEEEKEVDSTPRESRNLPPSIGNVKQRIVVEKEKDSRLWKLLYKHMVTEKEGSESVDSVESECDDDEANARRSGTVTLVREALEKILSEIPDNSSDDQSMDSDITTDQELSERNSQVIFKPKSNEKRVKGWNNVKKVILLKRFVSDLGSLNKLSPKNPLPPRVLPWEPDPETEKIRLRHQEIGGKRNSEEWMLDYALRQAISTLAPSQKRKVSLLAQAFDTISLQDAGSCSSSRNISRQSSISSTTVHSENEGNAANAEIIRGRLRNLQEDLKETTKPDGEANDLEEKQQCSSLWRLLCKQMEDNEKNQIQTPPEEEEDEGAKEETNVDGEKYKTEAVELLGEVIDGISLEEESQETRKKIETTLPVSQVKINRWGNLKRVILLRRFVKALENVRKFNPKEPRFLPLEPEIEAEKVNLRHQETQNKRNGEEWMVDNTLQEVVSKLTPARKLKVQLLVQAFESLSATGN